MKTIYKYELTIADSQEIEVPRLCKPLSVMLQNGKVCLWAEVHSQNTLETVTVWLVGTGNPIPETCRANGKYVGSVMQSPFIWHVYTDA